MRVPGGFRVHLAGIPLLAQGLLGSFKDPGTQISTNSERSLSYSSWSKGQLHQRHVTNVETEAQTVNSFSKDDNTSTCGDRV